MMPVDMPARKQRELRRHARFVFDAVRKAHGLAQAQDPRMVDIIHHIRRQKFPTAVNVAVGGGHGGGEHEIGVYQHLLGAGKEVVKTRAARHVHDLVGVRDDGGRSRLGKDLGELPRRGHAGFYVDMGVDEAGDDEPPRAVDLTKARVAADPHDGAAADGNVCGEKLLCEHVQDGPALQDEVGGLPAQRTAQHVIAAYHGDPPC